MTKFPRVAAIHDLSGIGLCSLSEVIPVLSAMGVRCNTLPCAYLSSHTGYEGFYFRDLTDAMEPSLSHWETLDVKFDAVYTGFLGSAEQIDIVQNFARRERRKGAFVLIDPVMGDDGKSYKTYTPEMCRRMGSLAAEADLITPNLTEAALLLDRSYDPQPADLPALLKDLSDGGRRSVVVTGIRRPEGHVTTAWFDAKSGEYGEVVRPFAGQEYHGTGDLYSSVLLGFLLRGDALESAVGKACDFVHDCAALAFSMGISRNEGVPFELLLGRIAQA